MCRILHLFVQISIASDIVDQFSTIINFESKFNLVEVFLLWWYCLGLCAYICKMVQFSTAITVFTFCRAILPVVVIPKLSTVAAVFCIVISVWRHSDCDCSFLVVFVRNFCCDFNFDSYWWCLQIGCCSILDWLSVGFFHPFTYGLLFPELYQVLPFLWKVCLLYSNLLNIKLSRLRAVSSSPSCNFQLAQSNACRKKPSIDSLLCC